ncbi:lipopolysaccharide biosynthesis protein [Methylobacterium sp. E-065]|uniref:lipopolysaccharide biosynthesis protein n=1 Tax=Methylobacterium sp. E-065 TaxID=2836583 RepID=UPI001FB89EA9|nr:lipopolysaccharide biosynthesis protein [Methylobacterium sp. E-065]MCJ2019211.1 lipopolysaccharide biosynthesis protein [Methylobacterium sp. E-065]
MSSNNTATKTAKAAILLIAGRLGTRLVDLATFVILARVLGPTEFGVVALAMIPIFIVEMITDLPISNSLIRTHTFERGALDTAFTLSLIRGIGIAAMLLLIAKPFAEFSNDIRVAPLVAALGVGSILRCLSSPAAIKFVRELDFRREIAMDLLGKIASFSSSVAFAVTTQSYWAIAVGTLTGPVVTTALSYYVAPYRPRLSLRHWSIFSNLAGWHSLGQLVSAISWQADRIILSRYISLADFGRYSVAENLASMIYSIVAIPLARAWLPSFSSVQHDTARLSQAYRKASSASATIVVPAYIGLSIMSDPAIRIILGNKWTEAAPILSGIAAGAIFSVLSGPVSSLALTLNRARFATILVAADLVIKLPALFFAALWFGVTGVLFARAGAGLISLVTGMIIVHSLTSLEFQKQFAAIIRPYLSGAVMYASLLSMSHWLSGIPVGFNLAAASIVTILIGIVIYTVALLALWFVMGRPDGPELMLTGRLRRATKSKGLVGAGEAVDQAEPMDEIIQLITALSKEILQSDIAKDEPFSDRSNVLLSAAQLLHDYNVPWPPVVCEAVIKTVERVGAIGDPELESPLHRHALLSLENRSNG